MARRNTFAAVALLFVTTLAFAATPAFAASLDGFNGDLSAYTSAGNGGWYIDAGRLAHTYTENTGFVELVRPANVPRVEADVTLSSGRSNAGLTVLWKDHSNHLWTKLEVTPGNPSGLFSIGKRSGGVVSSLLTKTYGGLQAGQTYHLSFSYASGVATARAVSADGLYDRTLMYKLTSADLTAFGAGAKAGARAKFLYDEDDGGTRWDNMQVGPTPAFSFVAVGDICGKSGPSTCSGSGKRAAALDPALVLTLGDNQYDMGALSEFQTVFDKSAFGGFRRAGLLQPVPGNHEYRTAGAAGYAAYFGTSAPFYRTFEADGIRFFALDSNEAMDASSPQYQWLRDQLAANVDACVVAYWHHPLYTSGVKHEASANVQPLWDLLGANGGDIVLNGHQHQYERVKPIGGMTEFVVGTGVAGAGYSFSDPPDPNSAFRFTGSPGVLQIVPDPVAGTWISRFVKADGSAIDESSGTC